VGLTVLEAQAFHPVPVNKEGALLKGELKCTWCQKVKDIFLSIKTKIKRSSLVKTQSINVALAKEIYT